MNITESRVYRGPNIWCKTPVIMLLLDLEDCAGARTNELPGFVEQMLELVPSLRGEGLDAPGLSLEQVVLRMALEVQRSAGTAVEGEGLSFPAGERAFRLLYPYRDEEVGLGAGHLAVQVVSEAVRGTLPSSTFSEGMAGLTKQARASGLGPSTGEIVAAAEARGIPVFRPDTGSSFVILGQGHRQRRIWATTTDSTGLVAAYTARDKALTTRLLENAGIPVPAERAVDDADQAVRVAERIGFPVVVKPFDGNHGRGVILGVSSDEAVREAYDIASRSSKGGRVLVQRQVSGRDYRVLVVGGTVVAVAERTPAHVIGDGVRPVHQLVDAVNADPRRGEGHSSTLTRIPKNEQATACLAAQGLTWDDVPERERRVVLSGAANLSTGGTAIDRTDDIHPANARLACEAALVTGLDVAGIDIVTADISRPIPEDGGAIIEVNTAPGFRMHTHPSEGQPRPVAEAVVDHLFPEGAPSRIPIVAVTGTNGKTTTTRMVAHLLRQDGRTVGLTTTDGVYIGDRLAAAGDMAGPKSARSVLQHPLVEAAALETARGGIVREGLGFDRCDVGIVTNVSSDHLGLGGIHTLEDLARVKGVVPGAVAPGGASVLNADDPLVMGMIPNAGGEIVLFSGREDNPVMRDHLARGGRGAMLVPGGSGERLCLVCGDTFHDLAGVEDIPATLGGLIRINAVNALAAAAAVWTLGVPIDAIREGLVTFEAGFSTTPGRFNFLNVEGRHVLIDYAHNAGALDVVDDVVRRFGAPRSVGMVAIPGDRSDRDTIALGEQTARIFDTLVIREGNQRGRPPGESAGLIKQGALSSGMREHELHIVLDEVEAAHAAVDIADPGDLVVIFVTRAGLIWDELSRRAGRQGAPLAAERAAAG